MRRARIAVAVVVVGLTMGLAGSAQAAVTAEPDTLNFGQVVVGATSETLAVTFTNTGPEGVEFVGFAGAGSEPGDFDGEPGGFEFVATTCGFGEVGFLIPPGETCDASFNFTPTAPGQRSVAADWEDVDGGDIGSTTLVGEGIPPPPVPCSPPTGAVSGPLHGLLNPLGLGGVSSLVCGLGL